MVAEPYFKSMETAARSKPLAEELGIPQVLAVANKCRNPQDEDAMRSFFDRAALPLIGMIPADETILEADRLGCSPLDHAAAAPAVAEMIRLTDVLSAA